jgi:hypothetical protein
MDVRRARRAQAGGRVGPARDEEQDGMSSAAAPTPPRSAKPVLGLALGKTRRPIDPLLKGEGNGRRLSHRLVKERKDAISWL